MDNSSQLFQRRFPPLRQNRAISRIVLPSGQVWTEFSKRHGYYLLDWKEAAHFSIGVDGRRLSCRAYPGASAVSLGVLRRLVQAYSASLRGEESLHATALASRGRSIALLGNSGEGKSTLAVQLLREGWRILCDDVLRFKIRNGRVWVRGAFPAIKLSREAIADLPYSAVQKEFDPNLEKWIVRFRSVSREYPLSGLFVLWRSDRGPIRAELLGGARSALTIQGNFYNEVLRPLRVLRRQFSIAVKLAGLAPVWRLHYPSGLKYLPKVAELISSKL